jgi:hypothetical protein
MALNSRPLEPRDPFNARHPATVIGPPEVIKIDAARVEVQAYTLPHHKKVSPKEWEQLAGREGYLKNQGFYVYREKRLIIYGTWFGLARQAELTKLARVRIDIPNTLDAAWKIDVKKASAHPPLPVRKRLRGIIDTIGGTSKRVYTSRGTRLASKSQLPVWIRTQGKEEIVYGVNREHPVLAGFAIDLPESKQREFSRLIEFIESTIPLDMLFADMGNAPGLVAENRASDDTLRSAIETTLLRLHRERGVQIDVIREMLKHAEPFRSNWDRTQELINEIQSEGTDP